MSSKWRRYEVLLPLRFNDGLEVPDAWLADAIFEIVDQFGAASYEARRVEGQWRHGAVILRDDLARLVVDVPDTKSNRRIMQDFKARWKEKLQQVELWMTSYEIEVE